MLEQRVQSKILHNHVRDVQSPKENNFKLLSLRGPKSC